MSRRGIKLLGGLMGEETARGAYGYFKSFDEGFANVLFNTTFGDIWCRPGLPTKMRSLITVAALIVLGRAPELRVCRARCASDGRPKSSKK